MTVALRSFGEPRRFKKVVRSTRGERTCLTTCNYSLAVGTDQDVLQSPKIGTLSAATP